MNTSESMDQGFISLSEMGTPIPCGNCGAPETKFTAYLSCCGIPREIQTLQKELYDSRGQVAMFADFFQDRLENCPCCMDSLGTCRLCLSYDAILQTLPQSEKTYEQEIRREERERIVGIMANQSMCNKCHKRLKSVVTETLGCPVVHFNCNPCAASFAVQYDLPEKLQTHNHKEEG